MPSSSETENAKMTKAKTVTGLRLDAQIAYLDGRVKRAKTLNREADRLAAAERARETLNTDTHQHARAIADAQRVSTIDQETRYVIKVRGKYLVLTKDELEPHRPALYTIVEPAGLP
jgi:hypothetical protein